MRFVWIMALLGMGNAYGFTLGGTNGALRGWDKKDISFAVNYSNCTDMSEGALNTAIDKAVQLWNSVPTASITLHRGMQVGVTAATAADPDINFEQDAVITCSNDFSTDFDHLSSPPGAGVVGGIGGFISTAGRISKSYVVLNSTGAAADITQLSDTKLAILIAHEMGHALGLGHSGEESALMYYSIGSKTELNLSEDDMAGLAYLYPRNEFFDHGILGCNSSDPKNGSHFDHHTYHSHEGPDSSPQSGSADFRAEEVFLLALFCYLALKFWIRKTLPSQNPNSHTC